MKFAYKGKSAEITLRAEAWMARAIQAATSGDTPILNSRSLEDKAVKDMVGALKRYLVESGKASDKAAAADMVREEWGKGKIITKETLITLKT